MTSIAADLAQARAWATELLTDTVQVDVVSGVTVDDLGTEVEQVREAYRGPALVQLEPSSARVVISVSGEQVTDPQQYVLKLPLQGGPSLVGATVTALDSMTPRHIGRRWRVLADPTQAWQVLRRCPLDPFDEEAPA